MKQYKEVTRTERVVDTIICNGCGKASENTHGFEARGAYDSRYPCDLESLAFDLCDGCLAAIARNFAIPPCSKDRLRDDAYHVVSAAMRDMELEQADPEWDDPIIEKMRSSPLFRDELLQSEKLPLSAYVLYVSGEDVVPDGLEILGILGPYVFVRPSEAAKNAKVGYNRARRWFGPLPSFRNA